MDRYTKYIDTNKVEISKEKNKVEYKSTIKNNSVISTSIILVILLVFIMVISYIKKDLISIYLIIPTVLIAAFSILSIVFMSYGYEKISI